MLSRKSYRQVVAGLKCLREQHEQDRRENPDLLPCSWGSQIRSLVERTCRDNYERCPPGTADETIKFLLSKGIIVDYLGDVTFPTDEQLPTREQVIEQTKRKMREMGL